MFSIFQKVLAFIRNEKLDSELMKRASEMTLMERNGARALYFDEAGNSDDLDEQMYSQQLMDQQAEFDRQFMNDLHDPYTNPGTDIVIDESYHGIDHGSGFPNE